MDEMTYAALKRVILDRIGLDIDLYKEQQMHRRLDNFVAQRASTESLAWVRSLSTRPDDLAALRDMLTINVSEFFRDAPQFDLLRSAILPGLLDRPGTLQIWSAACSNGQEPYSIAMLVDELGGPARGRILATDVDRAVLARARAGGPYVEGDLRNLSSARRQRYVTITEKGPYVQEALRTRVTFREHNLLADAYTGTYDLIVCRNVLIYFETAAKMEIIRKFHAVLKPGGVLFLGATEALLGGDASGFKSVGGNFYKKDLESAVATRAA
jgi:chemotaxis protein methyltransferase CheR